MLLTLTDLASPPPRHRHRRPITPFNIFLDTATAVLLPLAIPILLAALTPPTTTFAYRATFNLLLLPLADAAKKHLYALTLPTVGGQVGGCGVFSSWSLCAAHGAHGGSRASFLGCKLVDEAEAFVNDDRPDAHPLIIDLWYTHAGPPIPATPAAAASLAAAIAADAAVDAAATALAERGESNRKKVAKFEKKVANLRAAAGSSTDADPETPKGGAEGRTSGRTSGTQRRTREGITASPQTILLPTCRGAIAAESGRSAWSSHQEVAEPFGRRKSRRGWRCLSRSVCLCQTSTISPARE